VQLADAGTYSVLAANSIGSSSTNGETLIVNAPVTLSIPPRSQVASRGSSVTFSVAAAGSGALLYQWFKNGVAIHGAVYPTYTITSAQTSDAGAYSAMVGNSFGSTNSPSATLTVNVPSYLYNVSSRAYVGSGPYRNIVAGFYTDGSGAKNIVVRGIGPDLAVVDPALAGLTLASPKLTLNSATGVIATNTAWGGSQTLTNAFASVYAAPFQANSNDSSIFTSVPAGPGIGYTAQVDSATAGATGIAEVEVYDYDSYAGAPASRLVNISTRAFVGTGSQSLVAGFYLIGGTSQTLLIRAVGPGLAVTTPALSGLTLARPTLVLYDAAGNIIATNAGWGNAPVQGNSTVVAGIKPATAAIMNGVYASAIAAGSPDCAMVVTLPTGPSGVAGYTAQVTSADSTTGIALIEVYDVP